MDAPMPLDAPVTTATLPLSLLVFVDIMILFCGFVENGDTPRPLQKLMLKALACLAKLL
jgi:hypothetical protein